MNVKFFNVAKEVSKLSTFKKQNIGAVIVYKRQILSVGYNQVKTHTLQALYNRYRHLNGNHIKHCVHAEIDAISKVRFLDIDWNKAEIYIYREHKITGKLMMSKPCEACMQLIKDQGIRKIYYTDDGIYQNLKIS